MGRKIVIGLLIVVLAVAAGGWYAWHAGAIKLGADPAPAAASESAMVPSLAASDALLPPPPASQIAAWKTEMAERCASADSRLHIEHFDVDGDGKADTVCWRILKTPANGEFIDLQARVRHADRTQTAYIILGFDGGTNQGGICGPSDAIVVEQGHWTKRDVDQAGLDYVGPVSIDLNGTDCDPPWLFWPKNAKGDEVPFDFERE